MNVSAKIVDALKKATTNAEKIPIVAEAIQQNVKVNGVSPNVLAEAIVKAVQSGVNKSKLVGPVSQVLSTNKGPEIVNKVPVEVLASAILEAIKKGVNVKPSLAKVVGEPIAQKITEASTANKIAALIIEAVKMNAGTGKTNAGAQTTNGKTNAGTGRTNAGAQTTNGRTNAGTQTTNTKEQEQKPPKSGFWSKRTKSVTPEVEIGTSNFLPPKKNWRGKIRPPPRGYILTTKNGKTGYYRNMGPNIGRGYYRNMGRGPNTGASITFAPKINVTGGAGGRTGAVNVRGSRMGAVNVRGGQARTGTINIRPEAKTGTINVGARNGAPGVNITPQTRTVNTTTEQLVRNAGGTEKVEKALEALRTTNGNVNKARTVSQLPLSTFTNIYAMGGPVAAKKTVERIRRRRRAPAKKKRVVHKPRRKFIRLTPYQFKRLTQHIKKNNLRTVLAKEITQ